MTDNPETIEAPDSESQEAGQLVRLSDQPPTILPTIMLDDVVPFPGTVAPVLVEQPSRRDAVLHAKSNTGFLLLINHRDAKEGAEDLALGQRPGLIEQLDQETVEAIVREVAEAGAEAEAGGDDVVVVESLSGKDAEDADTQRPAPTLAADMAPVGVLARLIRVIKLPDDRLSALVQLVQRAQPIEVLRRKPFPITRVVYPAELLGHGKTFEAESTQLKLTLKQFLDAHPAIPDEVKAAAMAVAVPGQLADFVGQHLTREFHERIAFLTELDVAKRVHLALGVCVRELDLITVGNRITQEIREKVEKHQRDYFLREQLKAIRVELGEEKDPATAAIEELETKLEDAGLSEAARQRADEELARLRLVPAESPEHNVVRSYLEWIASLPWSKVSPDQNDITQAREVLDEDHYGLQEVKERILEYLAVRKLNPDSPGSLLCFAGPPGVGKTSLGRSIARATAREFYRFSVGGMRDEAEIKGHRRTYIGAMPGRILQGLRQVKAANPVFMLDEIDKMGSDWRGDPSSAMLEVLDPAQNATFMDHYLDLPFDLSRVMFIATANTKAEIPGPLLDRMEVIDLPGYIPEEKLEIARTYLVPRQRKQHGLSTRQVSIAKSALRRIIGEYTYEAGVRELERQVGKIFRKRATQVVSGQTARASVTSETLPEWLGPPKLHDERVQARPGVGIAIGLAWTPVGGDVLFIESAMMAGKGQVKVTGHLGEVMSESAGLAVSYVRSQAEALGIDPKIFVSNDFHLHFPAGAVRKDGPSAGVTVTTALISLLLGKRVRPRIAMTGEMTLRGEVLPVGGIREKVVAARRAGIRTIIVPERNKADVEEIPDEIREQLEFVYASHYEEVLEAAFEPAVVSSKKRKRSREKDGKRVRRSTRAASRGRSRR